MLTLASQFTLAILVALLVLNVILQLLATWRQR